MKKVALCMVLMLAPWAHAQQGKGSWINPADEKEKAAGVETYVVRYDSNYTDVITPLVESAKYVSFFGCWWEWSCSGSGYGYYGYACAQAVQLANECCRGAGPWCGGCCTLQNCTKYCFGLIGEYLCLVYVAGKPCYCLAP